MNCEQTQKRGSCTAKKWQAGTQRESEQGSWLPLAVLPQVPMTLGTPSLHSKRSVDCCHMLMLESGAQTGGGTANAAGWFAESEDEQPVGQLPF